MELLHQMTSTAVGLGQNAVTMLHSASSTVHVFDMLWCASVAAGAAAGA